MAHDDELAARVREVLELRPGVAERRMFGGIAWMIHGHMACGVMTDGLVVRLPPEEAADALNEPHAHPFGRPGARPMRGFVRIDADGLDSEPELARWVEAGADHAASLPPK